MTTPKVKIARLVPPSGDKHWSFQAINLSTEEVSAIRGGLRREAVAPARPFLQGCDGGWVMVEFWVASEQLARAAAADLAELLGVALIDGNFTRADLGLD